MQLGKISSDDLLLYLKLTFPIDTELEEARELLLARSEIFFAEGCIKPAWHHLYERPIKEHLVKVLESVGAEWILKEVAAAPNQFQAMSNATNRFLRELEDDDEEITEEEAHDLRNVLGAILGSSISVVNTLNCLLVFGVYLNDLIAQVRCGGKNADKALFQAVKIDPSVLGCPSVSARISQAIIEKDSKFFPKLQRAMSGKFTKREQRTYQEQRLVLQILHEVGAPSLSQEELYQLFVEELKIVAKERETDAGSVANNLRQFAYQFMKQKSVSQ